MDDRPPTYKAIRDASIGLPCMPWWRGQLFELEADYYFQVEMPDASLRSFWVPEGYQFDKASVPAWFWGPPLYYTPDGLCTIPSLEHDFLCDLLTGGSDWLRDQLLGQLPECPPAWVVHEHFHKRLHQSGVPFRKALVMGLTVAALGPQGWAWRWLRRLLIAFLIIAAGSGLYFYLT